MYSGKRMISLSTASEGKVDEVPVGRDGALMSWSRNAPSMEVQPTCPAGIDQEICRDGATAQQPGLERLVH
jgi:hypothetical protein